MLSQFPISKVLVIQQKSILKFVLNMKKAIKIGLVLLGVYFVYGLLFDSSCKLNGCKRDGVGWSNSISLLDKREINGGCSQLPCIPIGRSSGGYCSREHALEDM